MKFTFTLFTLFLSGLVYSQQQPEKHLKNLTRLTFGGDNAEAYWSYDNKMLTFQSNNKKWGLQCDQIFNLDISKAAKDSQYRPPMISTGSGRTTCSYYLKDNKHILYASTHLGAKECPPDPPHSDKYLWAIYPDFDIFIADLNGHITKQLTDSKGYDAEATVSRDGKKVVFTSTRSSDLFLRSISGQGRVMSFLISSPALRTHPQTFAEVHHW